jgi:hypothetical protein
VKVRAAYGIGESHGVGEGMAVREALAVSQEDSARETRSMANRCGIGSAPRLRTGPRSRRREGELFANVPRRRIVVALRPAKYEESA